MIYVFDLDGTLCSNTYGDYEKAEPFMDRIEVVNTLAKQGHVIWIETARGNTTGIDWTDITKEQLGKWGVIHHRLRVGVKMSADYYIDDKGVNADVFFLLNKK